MKTILGQCSLYIALLSWVLVNVMSSCSIVHVDKTLLYSFQWQKNKIVIILYFQLKCVVTTCSFVKVIYPECLDYGLSYHLITNYCLAYVFACVFLYVPATFLP